MPNISFIMNKRMKHIFNEVHYELTRKIAEGGMGMVYEAVQRGIGGFRKVVAIKLIREEYSAIDEFRNNFIENFERLFRTNIIEYYKKRYVACQKGHF